MNSCSHRWHNSMAFEMTVVEEMSVHVSSGPSRKIPMGVHIPLAQTSLIL